MKPPLANRPSSGTNFSRLLLALLFVAAGVWHFVRPAGYLRIMPPMLPAPLLLVCLSGAAEVAGGLGLLWPPTRRWAGWGLLVLLVAVFPANLYMALIHEQLHLPAWAAWARLPLQLPLMWWVWRVSRSKRGGRGQVEQVRHSTLGKPGTRGIS